jgi:hypothetical protein
MPQERSTNLKVKPTSSEQEIERYPAALAIIRVKRMTAGDFVGESMD